MYHIISRIATELTVYPSRSCGHNLPWSTTRKKKQQVIFLFSMTCMFHFLCKSRTGPAFDQFCGWQENKPLRVAVHLQPQCRPLKEGRRSNMWRIPAIQPISLRSSDTTFRKLGDDVGMIATVLTRSGLQSEPKSHKLAAV